MASSHAAPTGWERFQPTPEKPWNARRAVHLYRRAAFGATREQLRSAMRDGFDHTLERLLTGTVQSENEANPESARSFLQMQRLLVDSALASNQHAGLKAAWIHRMMNSPDPLAEQLTLMWHNHFATSHLKVQNARLMWQQNETFRRLCRGQFGALLNEMLMDPALLSWLDADSNRKQSPNENLARELLELFTLGIGNYSESDVKQAARALTGRTVRDQRCVDESKHHDPQPITILGRTEPFRPESLAELLTSHPATAQRLAWRICDHFLGHGTVNTAQIETLAAELQRRHLDVNWAVGTVLASELFFSEAVIGRRISPPAVFVVAAVRAMLPVERYPAAVVLADWMAEMGQDLLNPPNVGGWAGGETWLSSQRMIARMRFAEKLASGEISSPAHPQAVDLDLPEADRDGAQIVAECCDLLLCRALESHALNRLHTMGLTADGGQQRFIETLISLPEAQLD